MSDGTFQAPANLEAERAVLGAILLHGERFDELSSIVQVDDFYRNAHQRIFRHMGKLSEARQTIDALTVRDSLQHADELDAVNGPAAIFALIDGLPHASNAEDYAEIVREHAIRRKVIALAADTIAAASQGETAAAAVLEQAQQALWEIQMRQTTGELVPADVMVREVWTKLEDMAANKGQLRGLSTGLVDVDQMLGGLQSTDLIIIGARPAMGKTSLAVNIAATTARSGVPAAVFSLEMSRDQLIFRVVANEAQVNLTRLLEGRASEVEYQRVGVALSDIGQWPLFVDDAPLTTISDIRAKCRRMQSRQGLGLIVVDYLQLMTDPSRRSSDTRVLELATISRGLKQIAKELRVPVLALSQLSRPREKQAHRPQLSDLRDSGALEQDADVVLLLWREEEFESTPQNQGLAEIIVAKQRQGSTGSVAVRFCKERTVFQNLGRNG